MEVNFVSARMDLDTEKVKTGDGVVGVAGVELDDMHGESAFTVEGKYECHDVEEKEDSHYVTVTRESEGCWRWTTRKGTWWLCREDAKNPKYLTLDEKCPYYNKAEKITKIKVKKCKTTGVVEGFITPWGERFEACINYGEQPSLLDQLDKQMFENHRYDGTKMKNDWHFVNITSEGAGVFNWVNRAGVAWTLYESDDPLVLTVDENCPYYTEGHTTCSIIPNEKRDGIRAILGPFKETYDVKGSVTAKVDRQPDITTIPRKYRRSRNVGTQRDMTPVDYIVIAKCSEYQKGVYLWSNAAGESWKLYTTKDPTKLKVDAACPYQVSESMRTVTVNYNKFGEAVSVATTHNGDLFEAEKCPPLKATFLSLLPAKKYECVKYNNSSKKDDWHYVTITAAGIDPVRPSLRRFTWTNRLGVEWYLYETQDPFIFEVDEKCCYFKEGHTKVHIIIGKDGGIESLKGPWEDDYMAVNEFSSTGCCIA
eukprot:TRINITY_DN3084_c0_g1_i1.p1 TRINITY_DN3084_c0_g1~~TRINITY_DN3084_c0_g1_i1.p1  ORF type:complete len:481 (+),score=115.41 TRINITY_DN3084_c0_g1_i1:59-1501(+)